MIVWRWLVWISVAVAGCAMFAPETADANTQRRLALVIGISDYGGRHSLPNAGRDAKLMADRLGASGFAADDMKLLIDPSKGQIRDALDQLYAKTLDAPDALVVIYYAGHAVQYEGVNYLIPKGAALLGREVTPGDYDDQGFNAQLFLSKFARSRARHLLVVLDACRDSPFGGSAGLAEIAGAQTGPEWMVAFSAMAGQTASDGAGQNSPYTAALASELGTADITLTQAFERVRARFAADPTLAKQRPYAKGSLNVVLRTAASATASIGAISAGGEGAAMAGGASRGAGSTSEIARIIGAERIGSGEDGFKLLQDALRVRSMAVIRRDAENGDAFSLYLLGLALWEGHGGLKKDVPQAVAMIRRAVARGSGRAASSLGYYFCCDSSGPKDEKEAVEWFRVGSWLKFSGATRNLAIQYRDGRGVEKNLDEAVRLFTKAAEEGSATAWGNLGWLYNGNLYGRPDRAKARLYFQKAVDAGYLDAVSPLASGYQYGILPDGSDKDPRKALDILVKGGSAGCGQCWHEAGKLFSFGDLGTTDHVLAFNAYMKAVELGHVESMLDAASALATGQGTTKAPAAALALYERAAAAGSVEAKGRVGRLLAIGDGIPKNPVRASTLLREVLKFDLSTDPKVRHAVYQPNYWGFALYLGNLIEDRLVAPASATELADLRKRYGARDKSMKRFTVPIDCAGIKSPFHVYVVDWDRPNDETAVDPQAEWLESERGCKVPQDVLDAFRKLKKIARENNVSYTDLTVYALGAAQQEKAAEEKKAAEGKTPVDKK